MKSNAELDEEIKEEKISSSVFFIKANSYEVQSLWSEWKDEVLWEQDLCGFSQIIGYIDEDKNKPVNVSFSFSKINNKMVCFYYVCSRYNDVEMVERWLEKNYPVRWDNGKRRAMTNAMNFHHAINHCRNKQ